VKSSKEKVIADCEWAISKILSQGYTTVTSMQFFKDVIDHLKHPQEIVYCKDCEYLIDHYGFMDDGYCKKMREDHYIKFKPEKGWFCADGKKKEGGDAP